MTKEVIAVDIDEVLFPMAPTFLHHYNTQHGTVYTVDQMTSYYLETLTGDTEEYMLSKIKEYLKTENYRSGQPITGSIDAIQELRKRFNLALVTSRNRFYRGSTEEFLETHFGGLYDQLHYTHNAEGPDVYIPKHVICKDIGAIALVDDHLSNVISCAENGIQGILFGDYPWNQAEHLPDGVIRCKDWSAVLEYFSNEQG
jgi:5'(3')-deoxyribonucleotidase